MPKFFNFPEMKKTLITALLLVSITVFAQHGYRDGNRIGMYAGVNQTTLMTSDFNTKPELGWAAGMQVRGNYYNDWSMIFGMQFFENNFSVETISPLLQKKEVKNKLMGAQIRLLLSYNVVKDHVSIDFGPVLQVNDKLKIDKDSENNIVSGTALTAKEITDITKINGNLYFGISAGGKRVRFVANYQYGVNNIMNNLNKKDELKIKNNNTTFSGHTGVISGQVLFNL